MDTISINGPLLAPVKDGAPKGLVILLHGFGGNGEHMIALGKNLQSYFPDLVFAAPNGPITLQPSSHAWIRLSIPITDQMLQDGAVQVMPSLLEYIQQLQQKFQLSNNQVVLLGFSQGAIMALQVGVYSTAAPAGVVALAGFLPALAFKEKVISTPPVFLISGEEDTKVTPQMVTQTAVGLQQAGLAPQQHLVPAMGHAIDQQAFALVVNILKKILYQLV
ncbi:alpha/beta hydrolase [Chitinophaga sp. 30R24]|uniref:alpha/beta hydrolase n=1 Tax=Chitinophaga sp. 30R24 TaxID=3248838 RepID=UPI003B8EC47C